MRIGAALCMLIVLVGCGGEAPMPDGDLLVRVAASKTTVHPGEGVELTVTRVWLRSHEPSPWDDAALEPLILRDEQVRRREDDRRIEETRTYRAYVMRRADVQVPEVLFASRPREGDGLSIARSTPLAFTVVPQVDDENPGRPELPGSPPAGPTAVWIWAALLGLLMLGFEVVAGRHRWARKRAFAARYRAPREAIEAIRARESTSPEDCARDLADAVDAVRDHVAFTTPVPARARTTEELTAALLGDAARAYADVAAPADQAKFAAAAITPTQLGAALDRALALVGGKA